LKGNTSAGSPPPGRPHVWLAVVSGLVAFLLVVAWTQQRAASRSAQGRRAQLVALVGARQRRLNDLERQLDSLRRQLATDVRENGRGRVVEIQQELDRMALLAGTTTARGPGLVVELADSTLAKRGDPSSADFQIQDADLQLVVNALWESGAEAIAVNGQRLVTTSAIRSAGGTILVNYRVLTSPYRVEAIGDGGRLEHSFDASSIADRFRGWVDVYHLGFTVKRSSHLSLQAFSGSVRDRYAQPVSG